MIITHQGQTPRIDPSAWVAPDATVCGAVTLGPGVRVMHGARIVGESGGRVTLGRDVIIYENAVLRATSRHDCRIGNYTLIGPHAHVTGAEIADECYLATGVTVLPEAWLGPRCDVRVGAVVHLKTRLPEGTVVPVHWVAVGDPVEILPPDQHDSIWARQKPLDFPRTVFGVDRTAPDFMITLTRKLSEDLAPHRNDIIVDGAGAGI